jgi:hypothetical protein
MTTSYKDWTVSGYPRDAMERQPSGVWERDRDRRENVTVISNPEGWVWEVVAESGQIVALTIRPPSGERLTQRKLSGVPLGYLRDVAISQWAEVDSALQDPPGMINVTPLSSALDGASGEPSQLLGKPTPERFAQTWAAVPKRRFDPATNTWITKRSALTGIFRRPNGTRVSETTIDAWTREARDLGLIEPATTGKPRTKTPDKPLPGHTKKENRNDKN